MKKTTRILLGLACVLTACTQAPSPLYEIKSDEEGFSLYVNGKKTYVNGVGGANRLDMAMANGANAFRTWGGDAESIRKSIELAETNRMMIMQGIWLSQDSAQYFNDEYKNQVREQVADLAQTFKDDPQILSWGLGNEINLANANIGAAWQFVEELAQLIKSIDHQHLVSTVISHSPEALDSVAKYCPSLDYVGINSYGDIVHLTEMVEKSAYKGPFMVTEWGPTGWWETDKTEWGASIEQTSEEKRVVYETRYQNYIKSNPRCLGSFVFLWGQKEERTPTWFSMFVEDSVDGLPLQGEKTPMVEAMQRMWTGQEPTQTAPVLEQHLTLNGAFAQSNITLAKNEEAVAQVKVTDKENDSLCYVWEILKEATVLGFGGSFEPRPDRVGEP
ncbi:MAG: hypothetical protein HUJ98_08255, partial [Bacteroidaceae bacterium]|nr:hypothetical protein [Bacteroidaceae bacterium]